MQLTVTPNPDIKTPIFEVTFANGFRFFFSIAFLWHQSCGMLEKRQQRSLQGVGLSQWFCEMCLHLGSWLYQKATTYTGK